MKISKAVIWLSSLLRNISEVPSIPQTDICDGPVMDEQAAVTHR